MKKLVLIGIVFLAVCALGSCTNKEGDSEFETLTPHENQPSTKAGTKNGKELGLVKANDSTAINIKVLEIQK